LVERLKLKNFSYIGEEHLLVNNSGTDNQKTTMGMAGGWEQGEALRLKIWYILHKQTY